MYTRVRIITHSSRALAIDEQHDTYQVIVEQKEGRQHAWRTVEWYPSTSDRADARLTRRNVAAMYDVR